MKTSVQLYSTQFAWPFYDLFSVLPCLVSQFLLVHSTLREFLSLFLIAVYAKGAKFSVRTINHYQTQKEEFENVFPLSRN